MEQGVQATLRACHGSVFVSRFQQSYSHGAIKFKQRYMRDVFVLRLVSHGFRDSQSTWAPLQPWSCLAWLSRPTPDCASTFLLALAALGHSVASNVVMIILVLLGQQWFAQRPQALALLRLQHHQLSWQRQRVGPGRRRAFGRTSTCSLITCHLRSSWCQR